MPRLAPLDLNKLTPEQKKAADAIVAGPRGGLRGPFEPWLRRPELADRAQKLGEYCRFNSSLPKDLSELAICLIGRHFKAQYEFYAHARLAKEAGPFGRDRRGDPHPPDAALQARRRTDRLRLRRRSTWRPTASRRPTTSARSMPSASRAWSTWWACAATTCWSR